MEKNETEMTVKPILRQITTEGDKLKKRLSFAPSIRDSSDSDEYESPTNVTTIAEEFPRNSGTLPEAEKVSRQFHTDSPMSSTQENVLTEKEEEPYNFPVHKSVRKSAAGLYYVPPTRKNRQYSNSLPIVPLKENSRNIFKTTIDGVSSKTAKILILGNKCEGEKIQNNLLSLKETQSSRWSLKWELQFDIHIDEDPSTGICSDTNFFIYLVHLHALDSLEKLSKMLTKIKKCGALPELCGVALYMTSAQGTCRNEITHENLARFFRDHHIPYIHWSNPGKDHYLRILNNIFKCMGYNSGLSLLNRNTLTWNQDI